MIKTFPGTSINYGKSLPAAGTVSDGALYFKTDYDADGTSNPPGMYLYGFKNDIVSGTVGEQVGSGWYLASDLTNYLKKTGDVMSGTLEVPGYVRITAASGIQRLLMGNQTGGGANRPSIIEAANGAVRIGYGTTWTGDGGGAVSNMSLYIDAANSGVQNGLTFGGYKVWHAGNMGAGSTLDSDLLDGQHGSYYTNSTNHTGTIPVNRGGTGNTLAVQGAVAYGVGPSQYGFTSVGTAGQVLVSNGGSAPSWLSQSSIAAGTASTWATARTITLTGDAAGSVSMNGSANVSLNVVNSIDWSNIRSLNTTIQTFNTPMTGATNLAVRPSMMYEFQSGVQSPLPLTFPTSGMYGFYAYSSTDFPTNYHVGFGVRSGGAPAAQISFMWDDNDNATQPRAFFRVNDDSHTTSSWSNWSELLTTASVNLGNYVAKSGDTMSGSLYTTAIGVNRAVGPVGSLYTSGAIDASGAISSGGDISGVTLNMTGGGNFTSNVMVGGSSMVSPTTVRAGTPTGSNGYVQMSIGNTSNTGYIEFFSGSNDVRNGYIGYGTVAGSTDTGTVNYVAGTHAFGGNVTMSGTLASGSHTVNGSVSSTGAITSAGTITGQQITSTANINASGTITGGALSISGAGTISGGLTVNNNITSTNTITAGYITSTGNVNANNAVTSASMSTGSLTVSGVISGGSEVSGTSMRIRSTSCTLTMQDVDNTGASLHVNSGLVYFLRAPGPDGTGWDNGPNGRHPMTMNLMTGDVTFSGDVIAYSDRRMKREIAAIEEPIEKVKKLNGVTFKKLDTEDRYTGLIAQDVLEAMPEAVHTDADGMHSVAYGNLVGLLVEVVKKQQEQIEALQRRLDSMVD